MSATKRPARGPWWRDAVFYQVYIRSFADGNGDGVGDLIGLRSRLPYLQWLGVDAIWITPFFQSPMVDHGYDVSDPRAVDPLFGSIDDFDAVIADAHSLGLRVVIDVVPNHTSDQHPWFLEALASEVGSAARDRYVFRTETNNWQSVFGGPAWSLDNESGEHWLHLFAPEQPDLNWRNPEVHEDADATLRFWLDRGVDGFRIDVAHGLYKDAALRDNPTIEESGIRGFGGMEQRHTFDQPEVHDVYRRWRALAESYSPERVLIGEVFLWDPARIASYVRPDELHLAFSFLLLGQGWEVENLRNAIEWSMGPSTAWALSNHDLSRHATRFRSAARARAAALLLLGLPGAVFLYQGEELGLEDAEVPVEARQDPLFFRSGGAHEGRDPARVPMPWTRGLDEWVDPWLPVPSGWGERSVEAQREDASSMLALYRSAVALRRDGVLGDGFEWVEGLGAECLAYRRGGVVVAVNLGTDPVPLPAGSDVLLASGPVDREVPGDTAVWLSN